MVTKSNCYYLYHTFSLIFGPLLYKPQHFVEDFGLHEFFLFNFSASFFIGLPNSDLCIISTISLC